MSYNEITFLLAPRINIYFNNQYFYFNIISVLKRGSVSGPKALRGIYSFVKQFGRIIARSYTFIMSNL